MAIRKPEIKESGYYFITFTSFKWLPLFELANAYDLVYKWFDYMESQSHRIIAYVIMPNHIHLLLAYNNSGQSLNTVVGNGKRFLAYGIVKSLQQIKAHDTLQVLQEGVNPSDRKRNKMHQVFEDSFEVKLCSSQKFLLQKLTYIHNNPCSGKWMLADNTMDYKHSSACYYETNKPGAYPVMSWMELEADGWWDLQQCLDVRES